MNDAETPINPELTKALTEHEQAPSSCIIVIFGASGDLTRRLLIPSLFNLYTDGLMPESFHILGIARDGYSSSFQEKISKDIHAFSRRKSFNEKLWSKFREKIDYLQGKFDDPDIYAQLAAYLEQKRQVSTNVLFYMATPTSIVGMVSQGLKSHNLNHSDEGWRRIIVEKPFGTDLPSAKALNREMLDCWKESQIYRIDHYLGKEAVQNLLAFRFANGMFEPLWNRTHIDHIQITATERIGIEWRGGYYDHAGVVRDMIQNHLFQMLAYLCMEPPTSFDAEAIRNEKQKLLSTVRIMSHDDVLRNAVRGQYDTGFNEDETPARSYRDEHLVAPDSNTETFAALKLHIDNWRWDGVPVFLRSGKGLRSKSTEIVVQFKQAPNFTFRGTPAVDHLEANQLIFRIQPKEGIELRFLAKRPGPSMHMRKVDMRFEYDESFITLPGTGYETMLHDCMRGDASLFSRSDLVETAWKIVQPILDVWKDHKAEDFPNYPFGSWGPKEAFNLLKPNHGRWLARSTKQAIEHIPIFEGSDSTMLRTFAMMLKPAVYNSGDRILQCGTEGHELFIIEMGSIDIIDPEGKTVATLHEGDVFGELSLLVTKSCKADAFARSYCALYILEKRDFCKALMDKPVFAERIMKVARERYNVIVDAKEWVESS